MRASWVVGPLRRQSYLKVSHWNSKSEVWAVRIGQGWPLALHESDLAARRLAADLRGHGAHRPGKSIRSHEEARELRSPSVWASNHAHPHSADQCVQLPAQHCKHGSPRFKATKPADWALRVVPWLVRRRRQGVRKVGGFRFRNNWHFYVEWKHGHSRLQGARTVLGTMPWLRSWCMVFRGHCFSALKWKSAAFCSYIRAVRRLLFWRNRGVGKADYADWARL